MKTLVLILALLALAAPAEARHRRKPAPAKVDKPVEGPTIVGERAGGADRVLLTVKNPLDRAVWVYIECPNSLTETPVGIPGRTTADVNLYCAIEPGGACLVNHWRYQDGHSPERWRP